MVSAVRRDHYAALRLQVRALCETALAAHSLCIILRCVARPR